MDSFATVSNDGEAISSRDEKENSLREEEGNSLREDKGNSLKDEEENSLREEENSLREEENSLKDNEENSLREEDENSNIETEENSAKDEEVIQITLNEALAEMSYSQAPSPEELSPSPKSDKLSLNSCIDKSINDSAKANEEEEQIMSKDENAEMSKDENAEMSKSDSESCQETSNSLGIENTDIDMSRVKQSADTSDSEDGNGKQIKSNEEIAESSTLNPKSFHKTASDPNPGVVLTASKSLNSDQYANLSDSNDNDSEVEEISLNQMSTNYSKPVQESSSSTGLMKQTSNSSQPSSSNQPYCPQKIPCFQSGVRAGESERITCFACLTTHKSNSTTAYKGNRWHRLGVGNMMSEILSNSRHAGDWDKVLNTHLIGICRWCLTQLPKLIGFKRMLHTSLDLLKKNKAPKDLLEAAASKGAGNEKNGADRLIGYNLSILETGTHLFQTVEKSESEVIEMITLAPNEEAKQTFMTGKGKRQNSGPTQPQDSLLNVPCEGDYNDDANPVVAKESARKVDKDDSDLLVHEILLTGKKHKGKAQATNIFLPAKAVQWPENKKRKNDDSLEDESAAKKPSLVSSVDKPKKKLWSIVAKDQEEAVKALSKIREQSKNLLGDSKGNKNTDQMMRDKIKISEDQFIKSDDLTGSAERLSKNKGKEKDNKIKPSEKSIIDDKKLQSSNQKAKTDQNSSYRNWRLHGVSNKNEGNSSTDHDYCSKVERKEKIITSLSSSVKVEGSYPLKPITYRFLESRNMVSLGKKHKGLTKGESVGSREGIETNPMKSQTLLYKNENVKSHQGVNNKVYSLFAPNSTTQPISLQNRKCGVITINQAKARNQYAALCNTPSLLKIAKQTSSPIKNTNQTQVLTQIKYPISLFHNTKQSPSLIKNSISLFKNTNKTPSSVQNLSRTTSLFHNTKQTPSASPKSNKTMSLFESINDTPTSTVNTLIADLNTSMFSTISAQDVLPSMDGDTLIIAGTSGKSDDEMETEDNIKEEFMEDTETEKEESEDCKIEIKDVHSLAGESCELGNIKSEDDVSVTVKSLSKEEESTKRQNVVDPLGELQVPITVKFFSDEDSTDSTDVKPFAGENTTEPIIVKSPEEIMDGVKTECKIEEDKTS